MKIPEIVQAEIIEGVNNEFKGLADRHYRRMIIAQRRNHWRKKISRKDKISVLKTLRKKYA